MKYLMGKIGEVWIVIDHGSERRIIGRMKSLVEQYKISLDLLKIVESL